MILGGIVELSLVHFCLEELSLFHFPTSSNLISKIHPPRSVQEHRTKHSSSILQLIGGMICNKLPATLCFPSSYCRRQTTNSTTQLDTSLKMTLQPVGDGAQASTERAHGHEVAPIAMPSQSGSYHQSPSCSFRISA